MTARLAHTRAAIKWRRGQFVMEEQNSMAIGITQNQKLKRKKWANVSPS
jgi:hypothetical protein